MFETLLLTAVVAALIYAVALPAGVLIVLPEGTQMSGSIGGTTYSRNRFGAYKRNRSVPVNPNTDRQVAVRNAVRSISIAWETQLSEQQRGGWETYAAAIDWQNRLGQTVNLTGLNHFIRSNTPRVISRIARVNEAPVIPELAIAELELDAAASEATQDLTINGDGAAPWVGEADAWHFVYMGRPQAAGIKFFGGPWRLLTAIPGAGPPPYPAVAAAPFTVTDGQRIWVRTRIARGDGRLSEFAQVNFLAAA